MTQETHPDVLNFDEKIKPKLPIGLNILTILTFIGCAWELYSDISNFTGGKKSLEELEKAQDQLAQAPSWAKKFAGPEVQEMMLQALNNRVPLLIMVLIAVAFVFLWCFTNAEIEKRRILPMAGWRTFTLYRISNIYTCIF